jgi:hypothetical protein
VVRALRQWWQLDPRGESAAPYPVDSLRKLLARSLLMTGQPAEARTILQALLAAGPDPEASWLLSRCFIQEREWTHAASVLQQVPSYRSEYPLEAEPAPYVGEARCGACHRPQWDALLASRHATTFARARDLKSPPVPWPQDRLPDPGNPQVTHQVRRERDSLILETHEGQKVWRGVLAYAFGSPDHYTSFVGRNDRGQSFMGRMSPYRSPRGSGWDISTGLPQRPADRDEYLGKKMVGSDGERRCLNCHTTNFYAIFHQVGPEAADHSIGCERCHGPGGHHVAAVDAGFSDLAIVSPGEAPPAAVNQLCAKCHGIQRTDVINAPQSSPAWLRFQSLTMTWSRCYTEGNGSLSCSTCHDPHRAADTSAARNEAKCLSCHAPDPTTTLVNPSHAPASGGRRADPSGVRPVAKGVKTACPINPTQGCIDCHMPRVWVQPTHSFKTDHFIRIRERDSAEGRAGHE